MAKMYTHLLPPLSLTEKAAKSARLKGRPNTLWLDAAVKVPDRARHSIRCDHAGYAECPRTWAVTTAHTKGVICKQSLTCKIFESCQALLCLLLALQCPHEVVHDAGQVDASASGSRLALCIVGNLWGSSRNAISSTHPPDVLVGMGI